ncbi:hypothetical protein P148_SR1C00001G0467 [candidate division SR1 bacterium RAAC1_SR1_1]|nr:hypothetical protein P148_SR1C00001G0467 [candidate division SR1 bacterium RAAC1_SR1_1]
MDPMQPNQPIQPIQPNQPEQTPPPHDPTSLESFIRQTSAGQAGIPPQPLFQGTTSQPQIIEKIVYKKQRVHGFFRTLTILSLVVIGFLMLLESLNVFSLNINGFNLNLIYPIFILFSSIVIWSYRGLFGKIFGLLLFLVVVGGFFTIGVYTSLNPSTETKFGSYISYPSASTAQYSKMYLTTLVSDLTFVGKKTDNFLEGNYGSDRKLLVFSGSTGNYQYYSFQEETNLNLLQNYYSIISLGVTSTQPLYLYVKNLLALQKIDLTDTLAKTVKVHAGAMISDIVVGSSLKNLDIESSLADITIHLPKDVGVKLTYKHLVGQLELADFEQKGPGYFESTNIASAQKILNITMRFGGARTKIVWNK